MQVTNKNNKMLPRDRDTDDSLMSVYETVKMMCSRVKVGRPAKPLAFLCDLEAPGMGSSSSHRRSMRKSLMSLCDLNPATRKRFRERGTLLKQSKNAEGLCIVSAFARFATRTHVREG